MDARTIHPETNCSQDMRSAVSLRTASSGLHPASLRARECAMVEGSCGKPARAGARAALYGPRDVPLENIYKAPRNNTDNSISFPYDERVAH